MKVGILVGIHGNGIAEETEVRSMVEIGGHPVFDLL